VPSSQDPPRSPSGADDHHGARVIPIEEAVTRRRRKNARAAREALEGCHEDIGGEEGGHAFFTMLGNMSLLSGDREEAVACFSRALELEPNDLHALTGRGRVREAAWELELALEDFDRALALAPDDGKLHYHRGYCLSQREQGRYERDLEEEDESEDDKKARFEAALASLERAVALGFDGAEVYFELVSVCGQLGDEGAHTAMLDRALRAFPDDVPLLAFREARRRFRGDTAGADADRRRLLELGVDLSKE
jgi:tetratricopeptide (TPR) repeat protein